MAQITETQKSQICTICDAIPKMSEFDKGYFLGKAEEIARHAKGEEKSHEVRR